MAPWSRSRPSAAVDAGLSEEALATYRADEQRRRLQEAAVRSKLQQEIFEARLRGSELDKEARRNSTWFGEARDPHVRATADGEVAVLPVQRNAGRACVRILIAAFLTLTGLVLVAAAVHELVLVHNDTTTTPSLLSVAAGAAAGAGLVGTQTPHPASDLRTQAAYHKAKVEFHRQQQTHHANEERFHAAAYFRAVSNANPNGTVGDASITVDDWCASALYPQQARYFLWRAGRFDDRRPGGARDAAQAMSTVLYEIVFRSTALMKDQGRCTLLGAGHTTETKMVRAITRRLEPLSCRSFVYDQVDTGVANLKGALADVPSASVKFKGFADVAVSFRGAGAPITTLDTELEEIGRSSGTESHLGMADDLLIVRLDHMEVGELWRRPQGGALLGIAEGNERREPSARALKGLEKSLLAKRVTAVSWRRDASDTLRNEVDFVAKFGYRVYVVGTDKLLRIDGSYFDAVYTGIPPGGPLKGRRRGPEDAHWVGMCRLSLNLIAVIEGHPYIQRISRDLSVCVRGEGSGCVCDSPPERTALGSCSEALTNIESLNVGLAKGDKSDGRIRDRLSRKWMSKAARAVADRKAKAEADAEAYAAALARTSPLLNTGRGREEPGDSAVSSLIGTPLLTTGDEETISTPLLTTGSAGASDVVANNAG